MSNKGGYDTMIVNDNSVEYKMQMSGRRVLSMFELLESILGPKAPVAMIISKCQHDLNVMNKQSWQFYKDLHMTDKMITKLFATFELGQRMAQGNILSMEKITRSEQAADIFRRLVESNIYEQFWIILLNRGNKVINRVKISEGGLSGTLVDPKRVFIVALDAHATSIILGHNHPSGECAPSEADIKLTKKICEAGQLLSIDILDHIVVCEESYYSFADNGQV